MWQRRRQRFPMYELNKGPKQPFYNILVAKDGICSNFCAYVAEENLEPDEPTYAPIEHNNLGKYFKKYVENERYIPNDSLSQKYVDDEMHILNMSMMDED